MDKLPFSVYDFFGYLASGFVLLTGLAAAFVGSDEWQETPRTIVGLLLVVLAYAAGHVVANISGYIFESKIVAKRLGRPTTNLFASEPPRIRSRLMPGYYTALPETTRTRVLDKAKTLAGIDSASDALFFHCFARVKGIEPVQARLDTFLNLYGFCRNMSLALLVVGVALAVGSLAFDSAHTGDLVPPGWCAVGCLVGSVALFYRYLKFFRQFSQEVFTSYAELDLVGQGAS